jgi:PKD repeat protein
MFISKASACNGTPQLSFSASPYCVGSKISFHFSTTGVATVNSYTIDFGDGNDSTANSAGTIDHIYNSSGIFYIKLIRSLTACKDTLVDSITISPKPSAAFSIKLDSICSDQIDSFFANNSSLTYLWSYSTGGSASTQNSGKVFTNGGSSPITVTSKLIVTNGNGCKDSLAKNFVVMPLPNPSFSFNNDSSCSGTTITFTNASSGATNYTWKFGDGNTATTTNASHLYTKLGNSFTNVTAYLVASSSFGCLDSISKTINIKQKPDGSVADYTNSPVFTYCNSGNFDLLIDDSSSTASTDSTHFFIWGDGNTDSVTNFNASNISHTYTSKGYFSLKVRTIGKNKCENTRSYTVFNGGNPSVGFASPGGTTGLCAPSTLKFPVTSFSGNPSGTVYVVSSNDGSSSQSYTHPPPDTIVWSFNASSCGYTSQGGFTNSLHIKITAQNPCGTSQATIEPITLNKKPKADFTISPNDTICKNDVITFTDNSTGGSVIPSGGGACVSTYKRFWQISPSSNWDTIGGTKLGSPTQWFNNNPTSQGSAALQVRFNDTGVFQVKLIVANPGMTCGTDTIVKNIKVINPPIAKFTPKPDSGCINLIDSFINKTIGDGVTYKWTINPSTGFTYQSGTSDTSTNPILQFTSSGIYIVQLSATNPCTTSVYIDTIKVKKKPTISLNNIANGCKPYSISPSANFNNNNSTITAYNWTFTGGSPTSSNSQTPGSVLYNSSGNYTVKIKATNECGSDSAIKSFSVFNLPTINIGKTSDTICLNNGNYSVTGYSPSGGSWSGSYINASGNFNPSSSGVGTFNIKYVYTDTNGCSDTATKNIKVVDKPVVKFVFNNRCLDSAIQFIDSSSAPSSSIISRKWNFGDGNTSTSTNPTHIYASSGTYSVKLIITNANGCIDSLSQNVTVYPKPQILFSLNDTIQCVNGNSFIYTNNSSISSGSISSYKWYFGDTSTSITTSPTHSFADTGSYITKLVAVSNRGCKDSLTKTMKVLNGPTVLFSVNDTDQCLLGNSFIYNSSSIANGGSITNYYWDFGNGNTSNSPSPSAQTYSSTGTYSVKLVITNSKGCKDSLSKNIYVYAMPTPSFNLGGTSFCSPFSTNINNTTSASPVIKSWKWYISNFSSATISNDTAKQPTLSFPNIQNGNDSTYTVNLIASTIEGCKDTSNLNITIKGRPKTSFSLTNDSCGPIIFTTQNNSVYATNYLWSSNPSCSISNAAIGQPIFTLPRNQSGSNIKYIIKLISSNAFGCKDSLQDTVTVYADPKSQFNISNTDSCGPLKVVFTNTSTPSIGTNYLWDFGNGITSNIKDTNITYINTGVDDTIYQVKLVSTSGLGCSDDSVRTIKIRPDAKALFIPTNTSGCAPFVIDTNTIKTKIYTNANNIYSWYVNGVFKGNSTAFPGDTIINANDSILIKLKVTSSKGCKNDSMQQWFKTITNPKPNFNRSDTIGCNPFKVLLTNTSTPTGLSYKWELGNSSNNSTQSDSLAFVFTNNGTTDTTWKVKLIAQAGAGCKDSITKNIYVHPSTIPKFTIDTGYCAPISISPLNATAATPSVSSWKWNIYYNGGIYKTSTIQNPTFVFADNQSGVDSSFNIKLFSTSTFGCIDSIEKYFTIYSRPYAKYTSDTVCDRIATSFIDSSIFSSSSGNSYMWKFGDGDSSITSNPTHVYPTGGLYYNKLLIKSDRGCIDTLTKPVLVYKKPIPSFTYNNSNCAPYNLSISNTTGATPAIISWNWNIINSGNTTRFSNAKNPNFSFPDNQTGSDSIFSIRIIATTNEGCIDSNKAALTIKTRPVSAFAADTASCSPDTFQVTNNGQFINSNNWSISPASGVSISSAASSAPTFTFGLFTDSVIKTYTIKHVAISSGGCRDSTTQLYKLYPAPLAAFNITRTDTCSPVLIHFTNTSSPYNGLSYQWDFGNSNTSTNRDTSIMYTNSTVNDSIYKFILTTKNIYNCVDTQTNELVVRPDAKAYYTTTDSVGCAPYNITPSKINANHYANANSQYRWLKNGAALGALQTGATLAFPGATITNANDSILISLVAISKNSCKNDTFKIWFRTIPNPKPNFGRSDTVGCHPFSINFTDSSSPSSGLNYHWNLGNGQTSTTQNPSGIIYTNTGNTDSIYTIKLVVSAGTGCKDSINKAITVKPLPNPSFSQNTDTLCVPGKLTVSNTSTQTPPIVTYNWKTTGVSNSIANDTSFTSTNITYTDNQSGNYISYQTTLIAKSNFGCIDSVSKYIVIPTRPVAAFKISPDSSCGPKVFNIVNNSLYANGYIYSTQHKNIIISNANISQPTITIPENKGTSDSIYIVKLIAISIHGCIDSTTDTVVVHPRPKAAFVADSMNSCGPVLVTFTNNSTGNTSLNYHWDFGDGTNASITNPTHTLGPSGFQDSIYTVTLVAKTIYGCADTTQKNITVKPSPTSKIKLSDTLICTYTLSPASITITNLSIGNVDTFYYDFGDGQKLKTTSNSVQNHVYANEGHYKIKLTTYNECNTSIDSAIVTVLEVPHISFTKSDSITCDSFITITNTTSNSLQTGYIKYLWDFGDGTTSTNVQPGVKSYIKNKTGKDSVFIITLTAFNKCDTILIKDSVKIRTIPFANFNPSKQVGCSPLSLRMYNQSLGVDSSASPVFNYYIWQWGDSTANDTTYNRIPKQHTYFTGVTDTFTIKIWAYNECGVDSEFHDVIVYPNSIVPFVSINPANGMGCNPLTVTFTNNTTGANTFTWNFDSINTANTRHSQWTFTKADSFSVALTSSNGCSDTTIYIPIIVTDPPITSFADSGNYCEPSTIYFTNKTTSANSYKWYFGDGDSSIAVNPQHIYANSGVYQVKLIARNVNIYGLSCYDTASKNITIYKKPKAIISVDTTSGCEPFYPKFSASLSTNSNNYLWNFGNGNTSNNLNPSPLLTTAGRDTFYLVRLVTNNNNSCNDTTYKTVFVYAKPTAIFSLSDTFACFPAQITYTNSSSFNANKALWRFVNNDTSISFNTSQYIYNKPGNYTTKLIVTTLFGCKDSIQKNLTIGGNDTLKINTNDTVLCLGKSGNYICTVANPQKVIWDFGNGDTTSGINVNHTWNAAGNYTVIMTLVGKDGCVDTATKNIKINQLPSTNFTINDTDQCVNKQSFIYTNNSSATAGISGYLWRLGDGNTSSLTNVNKTYTSSGLYTITLIATTNEGCIDSIKKQVAVRPKPNPVFAINDSDQCINGNQFLYTNSSSISSGTLSYYWTMGDGDTSTITSPNHTYLDSGKYIVGLYVTSNYGCQDSVYKNVWVRVKPTVDFVVSDTELCVNGNVFQFANNSSVSVGSINYLWNFGDANTSSLVSPSHSYLNYGNYQVKLKGVTNFGCTDSFTQAIVVWPKPNVSFNINDTNQCVNAQNFIISNNSNIPYGSLSYEIDFGDGNRQTLSSNTIAHTYSTAGIYTITLLAISDRFCVDSLSKKIVVAPKPTPAFSINDTGQCVNKNSYTFYNQSTISTGNNTYKWFYGDASIYIPSGINTDGLKTYTTYGTYFVKLKVTSDLGCVDSTTQSITVFPKPSVAFSMNDSDQCLTNNIFNFTNNSTVTYGSLNYIWDMDDSTFYNANNPTHTYNHSDTFNVKLLAISDLGCVDSLYKPSYVRPMPYTDFSINDSDQCVNNNIYNFTNHSTIGYGTFSSSWVFGNSLNSNLLNPSTQYTIANNYQVKLTTTSTYGCQTQASRWVYVRPKPTALFTLNDTDNCVLLDAQFTNQSSTDVLLWIWNFDDITSGNNASNLASPSHIYYQPGIYHPNLIVKNNFNCYDTTSQTVSIYPDPVSAFTINPKEACDTPLIVTFNNISIGAVNYLWNFGNTKVSSLANPSTIYTATGIYNVSLISYTSNGCLDTFITPYIVAAEPKANYSASIDSGCMPLEVKFTNNSLNNTKNIWDFGDGNASVDESPIYIYNQAGKHQVTLAIENGNCRDTIQTINIDVWQKPIAEFNWNFVGTVNAGMVQFANVSSYSDRYLWNFDDGKLSTDTNPMHRYDLHGDYFVKLFAFSDKNCTDTIEHPLHIDLMKGLFVPNAFTPEDNTGDSRLFLPKGIGLMTYHIRIFTTWGELIWESTELENTRPKYGWDGTWKGHPCKQDVYVWKIDATFIDGSIWPGKKMPNGTSTTIGTATLIR